MAVVSAGLLLYRRRGPSLEVFLVHPGGPYWAKKDDGAWSVPKGLVDGDEEELACARREFKEETGFDVQGGGRERDLGTFQLPGGKRLHVWAIEGDCDPAELNSNLFEIDGNATVDTAGGHDWNQVFADNTANPHTNTAGAIASSFVTDETTGDDIYTGGSTKDTLPLSGWLFKTGKPQDKDEISHAYAAEYKDPATGDQILYAGLDRFANSGDSTMGAWFFVNPISKSTNGTVSGSGAPFTGTHATGFFDSNHVFHGDILLISNFSIGGSVSTIAVYEWVGTDSGGSLVPLNGGNPITGKTEAVVNSGPITVPWHYVDKGGSMQPAADSVSD